MFPLGCSSVPQMQFSLKCPRPTIKWAIEDCHTLGDHLLYVRKLRNHSQPFVAQILGVRAETISQWELNKKIPESRNIPQILSYLEYTPLLDCAGTSTSKRLKQFIYVNGITQREFGSMAHVGLADIGKLLKEKQIRESTYTKIQNFLDC